MIKVATVFSGIGAAEQALKQINKDFEIIFACDNGERYLKESAEDISKILKKYPKARREEILREIYDRTGKENNVKNLISQITILMKKNGLRILGFLMESHIREKWIYL